MYCGAAMQNDTRDASLNANGFDIDQRHTGIDTMIVPNNMENDHEHSTFGRKHNNIAYTDRCGICRSAQR
jgi:hypothetical protein